MSKVVMSIVSLYAVCAVYGGIKLMQSSLNTDHVPDPNLYVRMGDDLYMFIKYLAGYGFIWSGIILFHMYVVVPNVPILKKNS